MSNHFGMPGVGGSLGKCAICGNTFLREILMHENVVSFHQTGIKQKMYAHKDCLDKAEKVSRWEDLPNGPLREAFERHGEPTPENAEAK